MQQDPEKALTAQLAAEPGETVGRIPFDREMAFYQSICSGEIELVRLFVTPLCSEGYGILSRDALRNLQYHFVISTAMIARFCVQNGMTPERAYRLSDHYIQSADTCTKPEEIHALHGEMLAAYTAKMRRIRNSRVFSKQIVRALDFISEHLHSRILIEDAARQVGISSGYLSRMFHAETGMPFSEYVNRKKTETAACLLRYSEHSDLEISNMLAFSSQSYFIKIFRRYTGMTPRQYRIEESVPELSLFSESVAAV